MVQGAQPKLSVPPAQERLAPPRPTAPAVQPRLAAATAQPHPPARHSSSVIQRAIWWFDGPGETATQREITQHVVAAMQGKASRGAAFSDKRNLSNIGQAETLYIVAHGNGLKVGGLGPGHLAAILNVWLPDVYTGKIKLVSCVSATAAPDVPAALGVQPGLSSYAQMLSWLLANGGRNLVVQGMDGVADIDRAGHIIIYDTAAYIAWMQGGFQGSLPHKLGKGKGAKLRYRNYALVDEGNQPRVANGLGIGASRNL
jgi:hypothetical protein